MHKELERAIGELRVNHTDKEIAGALSEYFQIVKNVSYDYTDNATAKDIREDHPELGFMDDGEIVEILEQAKTMRRKRAPQCYHTDGYDVEFMEKCVAEHMDAFIDRPYGDVKKVEVDRDGNLRIHYTGGMYWHYKRKDEEIVWW